MLTMQEHSGTNCSLLEKAIDISVKTGEDIRFEFGGVWFEVRGEVNDFYLCADKMLKYVEKETKGVVQLF